MNNALARSVTDLLTQGEKAADGCHTHEGTIGIVHNPESVLRDQIDATRQGNNGFQSSKTARLEATEAQKAADAKAVAFITGARDVLKPHLGSQYSQAWDEAGFTSRTLEVPRTIGRRMETVKSLELYFTAHPTQAVAALNLTAAKAALLHTEISDAVSAVNAAKSDQRAARDARDAAEETLRKRLRGLMDELQLLIGPDDERWLDFGFRIPSDDRTPEVPADVEVSGGAAGHLAVSFSAASRADRYRIYKQVIGTDNDFVLAKTVTDTEADLNTFTTGAQVRIRVSALNRIGESQPSEIAEETVP